MQAEIFKQIRSNNVLTADFEAKNADRIARLVADNILVPLQRSVGKVEKQLTKQINLWLQVTDSCNLACDYCYIPSLYSDKSFNRDTIFQLFQHFKDIEKGSYSIKSAGVYSNLFHSLEKIGDHIINVTEGSVGAV